MCQSLEGVFRTWLELLARVCWRIRVPSRVPGGADAVGPRAVFWRIADGLLIRRKLVLFVPRAVRCFGVRVMGKGDCAIR